MKKNKGIKMYHEEDINKRLVGKVKHLNINQGRFGYFLEMNEDLNKFLTPNIINSDKTRDKILYLAYGYARNLAAAGLYLQGIFTREAFEHAFLVFESIYTSINPDENLNFEAFLESIEYVISYDRSFLTYPKLRDNIILFAKEFKEGNKYYCNGDENKIIPYEKIIKAFSEVK